jgi:hypothetical protein
MCRKEGGRGGKGELGWGKKEGKWEKEGKREKEGKWDDANTAGKGSA